MTDYKMKAEGYRAAATSGQTVQVSPEEWQRAQANLGNKPAGLSGAEWNMRLYAEVRRLRGERK